MMSHRALEIFATKEKQTDDTILESGTDVRVTVFNESFIGVGNRHLCREWIWRGRREYGEGVREVEALQRGNRTLSALTPVVIEALEMENFTCRLIQVLLRFSGL